VNIIFYKDDPESFWSHWNTYFSKHLANFRFLQTYIGYMKAYTKFLIADMSFVVVENGHVVGLVFLPIEEINKVKSISLGGDFTVAPLVIAEKYEKIVFSRIDEIAKEFSVAQVKFHCEPLIEIYTTQYNLLRKYGYIDASTSDIILSLKDDESLMWTNVRKSYKSLINGILKNTNNLYELEFINKDNADYSINEIYRNTHIKAAGRETRSKETFDLQFEMVKEGHGMITALKLEGNYISFNYFLHSHKTAIYMSAADNPDFVDKKTPFYHATLWASILRLKGLGFEHIQLSSPASSNCVEGFMDYSDKKQIEISFFKKGMGARNVPLNRGIKYYDKTIFLNNLETFKEKMISDYFVSDITKQPEN
jgi:hypothetical protein